MLLYVFLSLHSYKELIPAKSLTKPQNLNDIKLEFKSNNNLQSIVIFTVTISYIYSNHHSGD